MSTSEDTRIIRKMLAPALALTGKQARSLRTGHKGIVTRMVVSAGGGGMRHAFDLTTDVGTEFELQLNELEFINLPGMDGETTATSSPKLIEGGHDG